MDQKIIIKSEQDLAVILNKSYMNQIKNFFGNEKQAMKFLSSVRASVQKTPKLLECTPASVIGSFMTMAQLELMPSDVSGEAYVLPYKGQAQFQLGYQGLITLFYRAGGQRIRSEIVRKNDKFSYENGEVKHEINIMQSNEQRGEPVGAYAVATVNGMEIAKVMNRTDIMAFGKNFSKSFNSDYSPWNENNDPELWMWKKTVLKQLGKMLPKNETINLAIGLDNEDSRIADVKKKVEEGELTMGNFIEKGDAKTKDEGEKTIQLNDEGEEGEDTKGFLDSTNSKEVKGK